MNQLFFGVPRPRLPRFAGHRPWHHPGPRSSKAKLLGSGAIKFSVAGGPHVVSVFLNINHIRLAKKKKTHIYIIKSIYSGIPNFKRLCIKNGLLFGLPFTQNPFCDRYSPLTIKNIKHNYPLVNYHS